MKNVLLTIEYDGTHFCGWQRQPDKRSVQGEIERALTAVCDTPIQVAGTSRTDSGVHAYGQCASFKGDFGIPVNRIALAANNYLAGGMNSKDATGDVRITKAEEVDLDFHARFNAKGKKYIYKILTAQEPDIFKKNYCYHVKKKLDIEAMREAAEFIVGTHDFKCFQSAGGEEKKTTVRTVFSLSVNEEGADEIVIEIRGDGFLYNMVRIIVGTLVEVGMGKIQPMAIPAVISSKDRQKAGHTAPPQGLYLAKVYYTEQKETNNVALK